MFKQKNIKLIVVLLGTLLLIFDGKTAIAGAKEGVALSLNTLVPSLFPFFVLSSMVTYSLMGQSIPLLAPIRKLCSMQKGSESLLAVGILGGYPVGAGSIHQALQNGYINEQEANRLAVFCNNAGPSFIFGVLGPLFPDLSWPLLLWLVQVISAILTGCIFYGTEHEEITMMPDSSCGISHYVEVSLKNMGKVCAWVILFRLIIEYCSKWFLYCLPIEPRILITGGLELSIACLSLQNIDDPNVRFLLGTILLSFGGFCVLLQTRSVFPKLDIKQYLKGRCIHLLIASLLASIILFMRAKQMHIVFPYLIFAITCVIMIRNCIKKEVAIR